MKKYLLAISLLLITAASYAQQWTKERVKTELQKKEFLSSPELTSTLERVFDHQVELGGVRLVGIKTSAQVVQDYMKNVYFDFLATTFYSDASGAQSDKNTDQEMQDFLDNHLEEKLSDIVTMTIRNFADYAVAKYAIKYPKSNLTEAQVQANIKKVPNGIYYKTKNKSAGKDTFDRARDQYYVIVNNGRAYRISTENVDFETGNFVYRIRPTDFRVVECDGKSFQTVWLNDNPRQFYFAYDTEVIDLFEQVNSDFAQAFYGMLGNMESSKKKAGNRFIGCWRCVKGYSNPVFKVFGEDYRMLIQYYDEGDDFWMKGTYLTCEYTPDENVIEGGGLSKIDWVDDNTYTLTWMSGTHPVTEKWERQPLPDKLISFVKTSMSDKTKAKPLPKDPREQLDMLGDMADMPEKWKGYDRILKMPEASTPEGWYLKANALMGKAVMQQNNGKQDKALPLFRQAAEIAAGHETDDNAEAMYTCYLTHRFNDLVVCPSNESSEEEIMLLRSEEKEMQLTLLDEFFRLAPKEGDKWQKHMATLEGRYPETAFQLMKTYMGLEQHKKAVLTGNKALQAFGRTSDEYKNNNLYAKYIMQAFMMQAARLSGNTPVFERSANELTAFLVDVSEKYLKGEVSMDEDSRQYMLDFSLWMIGEYGKMHDYDRSEEYASLALTFAPDDRSLINYHLCKALVDNERYDEAAQLHTELLKDKKFVEDYLQYIGDDVAERLKGHIQSKEEVKVEAPAVTAQEEKKDEATQKKDEAAQRKVEAQKKMSAQLASVNSEIKKAQGGESRVKIKGYTASSTNATQAKKDSKGRVALPADSAKKAGVGIHFKF